MKSIVKEYITDVVIGALVVLSLGIFQYQAYKSRFIQAYNQAIARNAEAPTEELKFKQTLINEVTELQEKGSNLEQITFWLKTR